ncbi:MAG: Uncharacterised protein [Rhodospirillaceae bacterium]|nr:MAG: Uncharacterised protein [Rhodospirillaceae bacterium]
METRGVLTTCPHRPRILYTRVIKDLLHRALKAVASNGISIEVAKDDKCSIWGNSTGLSGIVNEVVGTIEIIRPEPDFVGIAALIAPLGTIKNGRGRMAEQQM